MLCRPGSPFYRSPPPAAGVTTPSDDAGSVRGRGAPSVAAAGRGLVRVQWSVKRCRKRGIDRGGEAGLRELTGYSIRGSLAASRRISLGMVLIEPGSCGATGYTDQQVAKLATVPILVVFGDHLGDAPTGIPGFSWQTAFDGCRAFLDRVNAADGKARMLHLPAAGIRGDSHMLMQDRNNLQVADLILKWIDENVPGRAIR